MNTDLSANPSSKANLVAARLSKEGIANDLSTLHAEQSRLYKLISDKQRNHIPQLEKIAAQHMLDVFGLHSDEIALQPRVLEIGKIAEGVPSLEVSGPQISYQPQEILELNKRNRINLLIQGAASVVQEYYHLLKDELTACHPDLYEDSKKFLVVSEALFLLHSRRDIAAIEQMVRSKSFLGVTFLKHDLNSPNGLSVDARAVCFPLLLHEMAKGIVEQLAVYGLPSDNDLAERIINTADHPQNEADFILHGYESWRALNSTLDFGIGFEEARAKSRFLMKFFQLPAEQFIEEHDSLTEGQMTAWARETKKTILS